MLKRLVQENKRQQEPTVKTFITLINLLSFETFVIIVASIVLQQSFLQKLWKYTVLNGDVIKRRILLATICVSLCSSDPGSEPTKESYRADDQIDLSFRKSHIHFIYYTMLRFCRAECIYHIYWNITQRVVKSITRSLLKRRIPNESWDTRSTLQFTHVCVGRLQY